MSVTQNKFVLEDLKNKVVFFMCFPRTLSGEINGFVNSYGVIKDRINLYCIGTKNDWNKSFGT